MEITLKAAIPATMREGDEWADDEVLIHRTKDDEISFQLSEDLGFFVDRETLFAAFEKINIRVNYANSDSVQSDPSSNAPADPLLPDRSKGGQPGRPHYRPTGERPER